LNLAAFTAVRGAIGQDNSDMLTFK
jgi:hypothetical protein